MWVWFRAMHLLDQGKKGITERFGAFAINWRFWSPFIAPAGDPTLPRIPEVAIITSQPPGIRGMSVKNWPQLVRTDLLDRWFSMVRSSLAVTD